MRFLLRPEALDGDDEILGLIDRLIDRLADEIHRIEVVDVDSLKSSNWFQSARSIRQKVLITAVATPPRRHTNLAGLHTKRIEISNADQARTADKLAHTPLTILVEDREADGILLDILVEELGSSELRTLWARGQTVAPPAMVIDTAGGVDAVAKEL